MKTIDIQTPQNVAIEYQLPELSYRIVAFIIDFIVMMILFLILSSAANSFFTTQSFLFVFQIISYILFGFYSLISEFIGHGQTIGKFAMGMKVVKINGDELEFYDYFSRWSMRLIDIYLSFGCVAMFIITGNTKGQRLGDILAGTTIIKKRSNYGFQLQDILNLNKRKREEMEFEYPLSKKLNEKDVLLIKNTIFRYNKFKNTAHTQALDDLTKRISQVLELEKVPFNKIEFLNKVISEYIILTR